MVGFRHDLPLPFVPHRFRQLFVGDPPNGFIILSTRNGQELLQLVTELQLHINQLKSETLSSQTYVGLDIRRDRVFLTATNRFFYNLVT